MNPARDLPFPVEVPYRMRPDLERLHGDALPELEDDDEARAAKRDALRARVGRIRVPDPERSDAEIARDVAATLPLLARLRPDVVSEAAGPHGGAYVARDRDGRAWRFPRLSASDPWLTRAFSADDDPDDTRTWTTLVDALALSLPEDLVWFREADGAGRASLLHVAFPSGWSPDERGGARLAELHGPVEDGERLRAASVALTKAMVHKGPFRRHVWSVVGSPDRDRHARRADLPAPAGVDDAWFRVEVQTTLPVPEAGLALFTIRLRIVPLREVLADEPGRAARLASAIASMTPEVLRYKGLDGVAERLTVELGAWEPSARSSAR